MPRRRGVPIRVNTPQGPKTAGWLVETPAGRELRKDVRLSDHLYRADDSWALDAYAVQVAADKGAQTVHVVDTETSTSYRTDLPHFLSQAVRRDLGHGAQLFLRRRLWEKSVPGQLNLLSL